MKPISIQSGMIYADESIQGWRLSRGTGNRSFKGFVKFNKPFEVIPHVIIDVAEDEDGEPLDLPIKCTVGRVTKEKFEFVLSTWGDHRVDSVIARWVAMAQ